MTDAFRLLGIASDATESEIRRAWRHAIKGAHPDAGGTTGEVDALAAALREALRHAGAAGDDTDRRVQRDVPSFTVAVLPVEAHEALLLAIGALSSEDAGVVGTDLVDSDPPYLLEFLMRGADESRDLWCRLELVPDAGATSVFVTVWGRSADQGAADLVRGLLVDAVNELDWEAISGR